MMRIWSPLTSSRGETDTSVTPPVTFQLIKLLEKCLHSLQRDTEDAL